MSTPALPSIQSLPRLPSMRLSAALPIRTSSRSVPTAFSITVVNGAGSSAPLTGNRATLATVPKAHQAMVGTLVRQVFVQPDVASAQEAWRRVADELRTRFPKAAALMDQAEADVLAHLHFPLAHRVKLHSTNTLERLNKEVKRRANVVGIFPNVASIRRLIGAVLMEQNEEWQLQHRYLPQHTMLDTGSGSAEKDRLPAP